MDSKAKPTTARLQPILEILSELKFTPSDYEDGSRRWDEEKTGLMLRLPKTDIILSIQTAELITGPNAVVETALVDPQGRKPIYIKSLGYGNIVRYATKEEFKKGLQELMTKVENKQEKDFVHEFDHNIEWINDQGELLRMLVLLMLEAGPTTTP